MRPTRLSPATSANEALLTSAASAVTVTLTPSDSVTSEAAASKAKPRTHSRSTDPERIASLAASLMKAGDTVPYCGPIATPTRIGVSASVAPVLDSPMACRYTPA